MSRVLSVICFLEKPTTMNKNIDNLAIFQVASGAIELRVDATIETVWANLDQIA
jgi:hypothetical protein